MSKIKLKPRPVAQIKAANRVRDIYLTLGNRHNIAVNKIEVILKDYWEIIKLTVATGRPVHVVGFGTFSLKYRPSRQQARPGTNDTFPLPEMLYSTIKSAKSFKTLINANDELMTERRNAHKARPSITIKKETKE